MDILFIALNLNHENLKDDKSTLKMQSKPYKNAMCPLFCTESEGVLQCAVNQKIKV